MGPLKILITGALGSLGGACVQEALSRGHDVVALARQARNIPHGAAIRECDLTGGLPAEALKGVNAIIHTAASMSNDAALLDRDTVEATKAMVSSLEGLDKKPVVVLASTILVYDAELPPSATIDESSPIDSCVHAREPYMQAKLVQEQCLRGSGLSTWALRIGAIYNERTFWNAHIGFRKGPMLISLGRNGEVPMVHLSDAACALVNAAETEPDGQFVPLNIVEDTPPERRDVIEALKPAIHLPLHWRSLLPIAHIASKLFGAKAPGLFHPRILRARMANRTYDNRRAKQCLGWQPQKTFRAMAPAPGRTR